MTNAEIIAKIKAEIERLKNTDGVCQNNNETADIYYARGARLTCEALLSFLSDLEKSEKPMQEGLEEEIDRFEDWMETYNQADYPTSYTTRDIARHFAKWGEHNAMEHLRAARRTEEAYQEVAKEMRKQIADDEELEEEIDRMVKCEKEFINFKCKSQLIAYIAHHFAQWGAEHLKK